MVGLAAATLAISACGGSDDSGSDDDAAAETTPESADTSATADTAAADSSASDTSATGEPTEPQQNQPVSVDGVPLVPFDSEATPDPAVGETAPVVFGASFDGTPMTVGGPTDNPTLVVFLAHWCPHCNDEIPQLIELEESGDMPEGLDVIGVSTAVDSGQPNYPPSDWVEEKAWPWPVMADDEESSAIIAMGGTAFPFAVVLDTDGTVLARRSGGAPAAETQVFLEEALASGASA